MDVVAVLLKLFGSTPRRVMSKCPSYAKSALTFNAEVIKSSNALSTKSAANFLHSLEDLIPFVQYSRLFVIKSLVAVEYGFTEVRRHVIGTGR